MRKSITYLWGILLHPRKVARLILGEPGIRLPLGVVLWFGFLFALTLLWTHLAQAYPYPVEQVQVWKDAWSDFAVQPFINIAPESYRLVEAIFALPLILAIWVLMAGTARLLAIPFGGKGTFDQYLSLFGFSFFAIWAVTLIADNLYNFFLSKAIIPLLPFQPPLLEKILIVYLPSTMGTLGISLGGVYNAVVTRDLERYSWLKAAVVGLATLFWPFVLSTFLLR